MVKGKSRDIKPEPYERMHVECYSGYKANERPTAFTCQEHRHEVAEIIDRWYEGGLEADRPAIDYFKVKTTDGEVFLLRYLSLFDTWSIHTRHAS
jgi:hypothetical protein